MNRKADLGDNIVSVYFIFLLFIVAVAAAGMIIMFFGAGYDGRAMESDILLRKIVACIKQNGFEETSFYKLCSLNKDVIVDRFALRISRIENGEEKILQNYNNPTLCGIRAVVSKASNYPKCSSQKFDLNGIKYAVVVGSSERARRIFT